jgi:uncharacterized protein
VKLAPMRASGLMYHKKTMRANPISKLARTWQDNFYSDTRKRKDQGMPEQLSQLSIDIPQKKLADFCRRHHIRRLAIFGSAMRGHLRPDGDVGVLLEFDPDHVPGLAFFAMQQELSEMLGRQVDLNTPRFLSPLFRRRVREKAAVVYEQT